MLTLSFTKTPLISSFRKPTIYTTPITIIRKNYMQVKVSNPNMTTEVDPIKAELTQPSIDEPLQTPETFEPKNRMFPLSLTQSFKDYWNKKPLDELQDDLLSTLPFYPEPNSTHSSEVVKVKCENSLVFPDINEFHVKPKNETDSNKDKHVVFIHGYGAGLGFFIKNIEDLAARHPDWLIHAIDLPGYGCSTRAPFPHRVPFENYETVEKLYTIPLRDWYISRGLDETNSITVAHSMGAYLTLLLQMKEVNGNGYIDKEEFKFLKNRFFGNKKKEQIFHKQFEELSKTASNPRRFWDTLLLVSPAGIFHKKREGGRPIPAWINTLWNSNISPFTILRRTGPFGSYLVSGWSSRRVAVSDIIDQDLHEKLHQYAYGIFSAKGSGEYMLNYMLAPVAIPRNPLVERLSAIGKYAGRTRWIYGGNDWIDYRGGKESVEVLKQCGSPDSEWEILPNAGHHVYLDALGPFDKLVSDEMKRMDAKRK